MRSNEPDLIALLAQQHRLRGPKQIGLLLLGALMLLAFYNDLTRLLG